ncbi:MAG: helix-turn-helix transcriptional regulator [Pseudomonadota bacterium]
MLKSSGSAATAQTNAPRAAAMRIDPAPGDIVTLEAFTPDPDTLPPLHEDGREGRWIAFACTFQNGAVDHIFLRLREDKRDIHVESILNAIWPVLRVDCIAKVTSPESEAAISAMLWTVSKKTDLAVFVLNVAGEILQMNEAGRDTLEAGQILQETSSGLTCSTSAQTSAFHKAIRACVSEKQHDTDFILFLNSSDGLSRVPVSLTRHQASQSSMPLVVAIVPQEPDRERIEKLALKMGLTQSEARVAALMQIGLPNREAARIAGLKEQTFNTYSKRVMAKLNVNCRAEIAHMLTWQAAMGRAS